VAGPSSLVHAWPNNRKAAACQGLAAIWKEETKMAHTETRAENSTSNRLSGAALRSMATMVAAVAAWRLTLARRRAIANLTPDQLRDIGHPEASCPTLDVKAGLITNLMSMR
jgi:hypothetical protein